jgi:Glycosyl transferase family 2
MNLELVVCAFGHSPHLISCLRSLVEQDAVRAGHACITVATSTPCAELEAAARCFGARYVVNPVRSCIGADWNFALDAARTPLVAICHQDDTYHPQFAVKMLALFGEVPGLLMASSSYAKLDSDGREHRSMVLTVKRFLMWRAFGRDTWRWGPSIRRRMLSWGNPVCCSSVVFNREALEAFRFDSTLQSNLDWDAWERIAARPGLIGYIAEPLVRYRVHSGSTTSRLIASCARQIEDLLMLSRFWPPALARAWLLVYSQAYRSHRAAAQHELGATRDRLEATREVSARRVSRLAATKAHE